jgi:hypothetical protein
MTENKYANKYLHSDVVPYEIIRRVSEKCLEVREMTAAMVKAAPLIAPGGFVGHFDNAKQEWTIESNPEGETRRIRLGKSGDWKDAFGHRFLLSDAPCKFYDWNF